MAKDTSTTYSHDGPQVLWAVVVSIALSLISNCMTHIEVILGTNKRMWLATIRWLQYLLFPSSLVFSWCYSIKYHFTRQTLVASKTFCVTSEKSTIFSFHSSQILDSRELWVSNSVLYSFDSTYIQQIQGSKHETFFWFKNTVSCYCTNVFCRVTPAIGNSNVM